MDKGIVNDYLLNILQDSNYDSNYEEDNNDQDDPNDIFPYKNTKVITFALETAMANIFLEKWDNDDIQTSPLLCEVLESLEKFIELIYIHVDHFAVKWKAHQPNSKHSKISIVFHGDARINATTTVLESKEYKNFITLLESMNFPSLENQTITFRSEFQSLVELMCDSASLFINYIDFLHFPGWKHINEILPLEVNK